MTRCPHCGHTFAATALTSAIMIVVRDEVSMAEIRAGMAQVGITVPDKKLYNAIGALTRRGRLRRTGYGTYMRGSSIG